MKQEDILKTIVVLTKDEDLKEICRQQLSYLGTHVIQTIHHHPDFRSLINVVSDLKSCENPPNLVVAFGYSFSQGTETQDIKLIEGVVHATYS